LTLSLIQFRTPAGGPAAGLPGVHDNEPARAPEACGGTGDLGLEAEGGGGVVTGLDFAPRMLERARLKSESVVWVEGDMLALPFESGSFDSATVGFGVRNGADLYAGLRELGRVLRPGGRLAVLEITTPRGPLRPFFSLWFDRIVPLLGKVLPGGKAYAYLPASVRRFPGAEALTARLETAGFAAVNQSRAFFRQASRSALSWAGM